MGFWLVSCFWPSKKARLCCSCSHSPLSAPLLRSSALPNMTDAAMNVDGREQNGYDWQSRGRSKDNSEKDDPLALHNLRTASASHREHATEADAAAGESLTHTSSQLQNSRHMLGLHPTAPIIEEHDTRNESDLWWPKIRLTLKEPFAEFFGVFIMV